MIEKHVVSLELSKKLKELGFPQESLYWWVSTDGENWSVSNEMWRAVGSFPPEQESYPFYCSAYLASELGELLPEYTDTWKLGNLDKERAGQYCCSYKNIDICEEFIEAKEVDARARMLIWLVENGHLKVKGDSPVVN